MYTPILVVHILVAISLVLVVLLQAGRGAELGAAFGSVGQATFSRGRTTFLSQFTTGLAVVFMLTSLSLAFITSEQPRQSVLAPTESGTSLPAPGVQPLPEPVEPEAEPILPESSRTLEQTDAPPSQR